MQESEAFNRELKARYAAIVAETLGRAQHCLHLARAARRAGNRAERLEQLSAGRVLWMAAAEWRKRAQRIAPVLMCLLWLAGCATPPPVTVNGHTIPYKVVRAVCAAYHDARWNGHADVLLDAEGHIGGLECWYGDGGYGRVVHISDPRARPLAEFLEEREKKDAAPVPSSDR